MILALDSATKCGWARGAAGVAVPQFGTADFSGGSTGQVVYNFRHWLADIIIDLRPRVIVFESIYVPHGLVRNPKTLRRLYTIAGEIEAAAYEASIDVYEATASEISKFFLGTSRPLKREAKKLATIEMCRQYGWDPQDDNAADALAIWAMAEAKFDPAAARRRGDGPLFIPRKCDTPQRLPTARGASDTLPVRTNNVCQENTIAR